MSILHAGPAGAGTATSSVAEREVARRAALLQQAKTYIAEAAVLESKGDYADAASHYREAWNLLPNAPMAATLRAEARDGYSRTAVQHARKLAKEAHYKEARALLATVLAPDFNPGYADAVRLEKELDDPDRYEPALTPGHLAKVAEVEDALRKGWSFLNLGNYDKANDTFKEALRIDPYNKAARRGMEQAEQYRAQYFDVARDHTRAKMLATVDAQWEDAVPADLSKLFGTAGQLGVMGGTRESNLLKLRTFMVPIVELQGAGLEEVIEFLRIRSRELDPQKKGVDFVLKVSPEIANKPVSLNMVGVPLEEVLRYATEMTGTIYRVDEYAVTITSRAERSDTLISRSYRVPPDFLQNAPAGDVGAAPANPFDPKPAGGGTGLTIRRMGVREFLEQRGVKFPEGAGASYSPATNILSVRNTEENLVLVDTMVDELSNAVPKQVEIQVRMIEVNQTHFNELGFDWMLGQFNLPGTERVFASGGTGGNQRSGAFTSADFSTTYPGSGGLPVGVNPVTAGLRSSGAILGTPSIDGLIGQQQSVGLDSRSPGTFAITGVFTDPSFQMVLRAIHQSKGIDFMAAPSVVTKSGQRSRISVSREFIYPTEFDPPQIPQTLSALFIYDALTGFLIDVGMPPVVPVTPSTPTAFEMREVGVTMEVEPVVGPDNRTVELNLVPSLTEFEGFINYGEPITLAGQNVPPNTVATPNDILQPVFRSNKISTNVTVYDGSTVVLGGVMYEKRQDINDKVPIIGNIPIVGRAFQSQLDQVEKKNVLFYVTVKILDPGGNRVTPEAAPLDAAAAEATVAR
ncbi:Amuc_1098 family type IV pilus outer membrane protein [Roseimicrobium sp. ORNL1]|uniref:Amuc_1098 family type IV pilus outer membrane protein n=1 Tax=Roseimicrobium sp. ORNL1 TaxID=2711231 RepID=UPI001F103CD6|nr:Amuc_1098 family type IV pilus outer membrane protein [Roseimicrobium sp. ORNL1]